MRRFFGITVFLIMLACAQSTYADTDYVCLKECARNSGNAASCLPKCSYAPATSVDGSEKQFGPNPQYKCFAKCLNDGEKPSVCQYQCAPLRPTPEPAKTPKDYNPNVLENIETYDDNLIMPEPKLPKTSLDAICMKRCLNGHLKYQTCARNCTH